MGVVNKSISTWRPYANCTRGEAFLMLYRIMTKTSPDPHDDDYFHPLNTTLKTIALGMGLPLVAKEGGPSPGMAMLEAQGFWLLPRHKMSVSIEEPLMAGSPSGLC